jgi:DNA-directed RNA polymerase specialized sigma24 family protein
VATPPARGIALAAVGIALLAIGLLLGDDRGGIATALIVIGAGQVTMGVLLPQLTELEIGPGGFKAKLRARDEEIGVVVERQGRQLAELAAFLGAGADGAQGAAEAALARTYAEAPPPEDPVARAKRHLVERVTMSTRAPPPAEPGPPEGDAWRRLSTALATLPAESRAALVLSVHDGMSEEEIAELLGGTVEAVSEELTEAGRALAATLAGAR